MGKALGRVSTVSFRINVNFAMHKNFSTHTLQNVTSTLSIVLNHVNFSVFKAAVKYSSCAGIEIFSPHKYTFKRNAVTITDTGKIFQGKDFNTNEMEWINGSLSLLVSSQFADSRN